MKKYLNKIVIIRIFLITFSILIILNILLGGKNIFLLKTNFEKLKNVELIFSKLTNEFEKIKFVHDEFKKDNFDLQETMIRESLNYKYKDEKIIIYE